MMVKWSSFACAGYTCVCFCVYVCVFDYQLQHSFKGYNWDYIFVVRVLTPPPPPTDRKKSSTTDASTTQTPVAPKEPKQNINA